MSGFWQDVRLAARRLKKSPGFTLVAALILAIGIGANTAIFSVVDSVLIHALPYPGAERLASIAMENREGPGETISYKTFADWRERSRTLESAAAYNYSWDPAIVGSDGRAELLAGKGVTYDFFHVLGIQPALGRDFRIEDDRDGAPEVVILSYGVWRTKFAADPHLVGGTIRLSEHPYTVIGILPEDFRPTGFTTLERATEIWAPLRYGGSKDGECRNCEHLSAITRVREGVTIEQAGKELDEIQRNLNRAYPKEYSKDRSASIVAFQEGLVGHTRPALYSLLGAVAFVLLICCANLANLFLIRCAERRREIATRVALGAGRFRIVRQLLTENLLVAFLGGSGGLLLSVWLTPFLLSLAPANLPRMTNVTVDSRMLLFTLVISLLTGIAFGVLPALRGSRIRIQDSLKLGGLGSRGATADGPRSVLGVAEIALALVLATGAGLLLRSFSTVLGVDPGFDPNNLVTVEVSVQGEKYRDRAARSRFYVDVVDQVEAVPGVTAAGWVTNLPIGGGFDRRGLCIQERAGCPSPEDPSADSYAVTPDYFRAMKISLRDGRLFTMDDDADHEPVAIVGETLAAQQWPGQNAIGKKLRLSGFGEWRTVIGVVGDVRHYGLEAAPTMQAYVPVGWGILVARINGPLAGMNGALREAIAKVDPAIAIFKISTMEERVSGSVAQRRFALLLISCFAIVALFLAALGLYGVLAYSVSRRTQEIGIRVALGALRSDILRLVFAQASKMVLAGLAIGLVAALAMARLLSSQLFGVGAGDPLTFTVVSIILAAVAAFACYLPARRASKVDPLTALRYE